MTLGELLAAIPPATYVFIAIDRYRYIYTPSQYDCTGQPFTLSHKLFKRGGRWMAYHHYAIDV